MSAQRKLALFLFLTFGLSLISYVPIIRAGTLNTQGGLFVLTLMLSPGLAAILTQLVAARSLRGMGWRPGRARWLGIAYVLPIAYALPVYGLTWLTGLGIFPNPDRIAQLADRYSSSGVAATVGIFVLVSATVGMAENLISALFEEVGWRGMLVPELAKVADFTKTALISGVIWAAWHMPVILLADYNSSGAPAAYSALCFAVMIIALSFPMAWLTLKSRSLWPAALLHASHNLFVQGILDQLTAPTRFTPYIVGEFGIGLALTVVVVAYVVWRGQHGEALRPRRAASGPAVQAEHAGVS